MPRKGPGGIRTGTPGKAYSNRTDMNQNQGSTQPIAAAPNQPYGVASAQKAAQRTVPLPVAAAPIKPFSRPTERPNEPVTAGLPVGEGSNLSPLHFQTPVLAPPDPVAFIKSAAIKYPDNYELQSLYLKAVSDQNADLAYKEIR